MIFFFFFFFKLCLTDIRTQNQFFLPVGNIHIGKIGNIPEYAFHDFWTLIICLCSPKPNSVEPVQYLISAVRVLIVVKDIHDVKEYLGDYRFGDIEILNSIKQNLPVSDKAMNKEMHAVVMDNIESLLES